MKLFLRYLKLRHGNLADVASPSRRRHLTRSPLFRAAEQCHRRKFRRKHPRDRPFIYVDEHPILARSLPWHSYNTLSRVEGERSFLNFLTFRARIFIAKSNNISILSLIIGKRSPYFMAYNISRRDAVFYFTRISTRIAARGMEGWTRIGWYWTFSSKAAP